MSDQAPLVKLEQARVAAVTIAADATETVGESPVDGTVAAVTYTADAAVTGAASPASRTLSLVNKKQDGSGSTVVATLALLSGVNLVAFDEKTIPLSSTPADLVVAAGDVLEWTSTHIGGTGLVDPGGLVQVTIARS